jgi:hypothetical protein
MKTEPRVAAVSANSTSRQQSSVAITVTAQPAVTAPSNAAVMISVPADPAPQENLVTDINAVYSPESAGVYKIATDPDYEALQWAGLTAAMEIIND